MAEEKKSAPEAQETPETQEVPETQETPETSEVPETPEISETPETSETSEAPEAKKSPKAKKASKASKAPKARKASAAPKAPKSVIGKTQLNELMKKLPLPVQEHSARCKKICDYLIERALPETWFIDSGLNPEVVRSAVYYHDIGKSEIALDYIYAEFCSDTEQLEVYQNHTVLGRDLIESNFSIVLDSMPDRSFEKELQNVILQHHERMDGTGFPKNLDVDTIAMSARICAVVDTFDNLLFSSKFNFADSLTKLKKESGRHLDSEIVDTFIGNPETLEALVNDLSGSAERKARRDTFGMRLMFDPVYDIVESNDYRKKIIGYICRLYINDPYFGLIAPEAYVVAAEKTGQIYKLDKLALDKLTRLFLDMKDEGISCQVPVFFKISFLEFEKPEVVPEKKRPERKNAKLKERADAELVAKPGDNKLLAHLRRSNLENEIPQGAITLCLNETDIVNSGFDINQMCTDIHDSQATFAIEGFADGASVITMLDKAQSDYILMSPGLIPNMIENPRSFDMTAGMTATMKKLGIEPIFIGVKDSGQRGLLMRAGARWATVTMWDHMLDSKGFVKSVKEQQGTEGAGL